MRDHVTQAALRAEGIVAPLCPDPAVMVVECFGEAIRQRRQQGAVKTIQDAFPQGHLACQFSADFADDASLDALAQGLSRAAAATGLGLVPLGALQVLSIDLGSDVLPGLALGTEHPEPGVMTRAPAFVNQALRSAVSSGSSTRYSRPTMARRTARCSARNRFRNLSSRRMTASYAVANGWRQRWRWGASTRCSRGGIICSPRRAAAEMPKTSQ